MIRRPVSFTVGSGNEARRLKDVAYARFDQVRLDAAEADAMDTVMTYA